MAADPLPDLGAAVTSEEAFDPAVKWFQKRLGMTRAQVDQMTLDARRKVFFVTGLSDLELIKSVQDSLARALEEGKTFEEWKAEVKEKKLFQGPEFTKRRLETIFRTNMQNAFATGRYMEMTSPAMLKRRPYWKFSAVRDGRTTSTCAAAHGTILPANHPWWKTHIPPLHFNCRSTIVPLSERRAKELGITKHPPPAPSALGFGNPPDGVPAAAKDMPTEAERKKAEKASDAVQTAIEKRQNASAELREARHRRTVAAKEAKQARKEAVQAPPSEFKEKTKAADAAQQRKVAADRQVAQAERELQQANLTAEKAARKGQPGTWRLVPERLKRLAKGVAAGAARVLGNILGLFKRLKDAVLDGVPVLEGVTPDGQKIYFGRGDITRAPLMRYAGSSQHPPRQPRERTVWPSREENPHPPAKPLKEADKKHYSLKKLLEARSLGSNNTVKIGNFDMKEEIKAILDGRVSERTLEDGTREYIINGRKYGAHSPQSGQGSWPIYPKEGPGLLKISEDVVKAAKKLLEIKNYPDRKEQTLRRFSREAVRQAEEILRRYLDV